jgi:hypothetical protein
MNGKKVATNVRMGGRLPRMHEWKERDSHECTNIKIIPAFVAKKVNS